MKIKSIRLLLLVTKLLITASLKFFDSVTIALSIDNIAKADSLSVAIVLRRKVLILFKVEKHLSASAVVIGVVIRIFNNLTVSENADCKLLSFIILSRSMRFCDLHKSSLVYNTVSSVLSFSLGC